MKQSFTSVAGRDMLNGMTDYPSRLFALVAALIQLIVAVLEILAGDE